MAKNEMAKSINGLKNDEQAREYLAGLGVPMTRQTLFNLRQRKAIAYHKLGGKVLYRKEDLDAFFNNSRKEAAVAVAA
jgi:hypothetical protein